MNTIDNRIVQMQFQNSQFEKGVKESIDSLEKLKKSLKLEESVKSIEELQRAGDSFSLAKMSNAIDGISDKFSVLGIIGKRVLENLADSAYKYSVNMLKSFSVDQISSGWQKYADKTKAVQQIVNATGLSIENVNEQLEKLNWFTDETSYNFSDMVSNIGKFTSMNIPLDRSVTAMQGISTWAALSGAGVNEASRAMYNLSQAMGLGALKLQDWKSIVYANMATAEFKQTAIDTAVAMGTLKEGQVDLNNFESTLQKGWLNSDVLMAVLEKYGDFANKVYEIAKREGIPAAEAMKRLGNEIDTLGGKGFRAAQEAKTFQEAITATTDAVSSGWMNTFEMIFGNYEEAKVLWTDLANALWDIFASGASERNQLLAVWKDLEGRDTLIEGIYSAFSALNGILLAVKEAFRDIFPETTVSDLLEISGAVRDFGENLKNLFHYDTTEVTTTITYLEQAAKAIDVLGQYSKEGINYGLGKSLEKYFSGGNVDLLGRKVKTGADMYKAGYEEFKDATDDMVTYYSQSLLLGEGNKEHKTDFKFDENVVVDITPIDKNGNILSPESLDEYLQNIVSKSTSIDELMANDSTANGGKGLILHYSLVEGEDWQAGIEASEYWTNMLHSVSAAYDYEKAHIGESAIDYYRSLLAEAEQYPELTDKAIGEIYDSLDGLSRIIAQETGDTELYDTLQKLKGYFDETTTSASDFKGELKRGARSDEVKELQQRLTELGISVGKAGVDGIFGPDTEKALKEFEEKYGLTIDGIYDETTHKKMNEALGFTEETPKYITETTESIENLSPTLANIQRMSRGLFAIVHIGTSALKFLGNVIGYVGEMLSPIADAILEIGGAIGDGLVYLDKLLTDSGALESLLSSIKGWLKPVGDFAQNAADGLLTFLGIGEKAGDASKDTFTLATIWDSFTASIKKTGSFDKLIKSFAKLRSSIGIAARSIKRNLSIIGKGLGKGLTNILKAIPGLLGKIVSGIFNLVAGGLNILSDWILKIPVVLPKIRKFWDTLFNGDGRKERRSKFFKDVKSGFESVVDYLFGKGDPTKGKAPGVLRKFWSFISGDIEGYTEGMSEEDKQKVLDRITSVKTFFQNIEDAIRYLFTGTISEDSQLSSDARSSIEQIRGTINEVIDSVRGFIESIGPSLKLLTTGHGGEGLDSETWISVMKVRNNIKRTIAAIKLIFGNDEGSNYLSDEEKSRIEGLRDSVIGTIESIIDFVKDIAAKIRLLVTGTYEDLSEEAAKKIFSIRLSILRIGEAIELLITGNERGPEDTNLSPETRESLIRIRDNVIGAIESVVGFVKSISPSVKLLTTGQGGEGLDSSTWTKIMALRNNIKRVIAAIKLIFGNDEGSNYLSDEEKSRIEALRDSVIGAIESIIGFVKDTAAKIGLLVTGTYEDLSEEAAKKIFLIRLSILRIGEAIELLITGNKRGAEDTNLSPETRESLIRIRDNVIGVIESVVGFVKDTAAKIGLLVTGTYEDLSEEAAKKIFLIRLSILRIGEAIELLITGNERGPEDTNLSPETRESLIRIRDNVIGAIESVVGFVKSIGPSVKLLTTGQGGEGLSEKAQNTILNVRSTVKRIIAAAKLLTGDNSDIGWLNQKEQKTLNNIRDGVLRVINNIVGFFKSIGPAFNLLTTGEGGEGLSEKAQNTILNVRTNMNRIFAAIRVLITGSDDSEYLTDKEKNDLKNFRDSAISVINSVIDFVAKFFKSIGPAIGLLTTGNGGEELGKETREKILKVRSVILGIFEAINLLFTGKEIEDESSNLAPEIKNTIKNIRDNIKIAIDAIGGFFNNIGEFISGLFGNNSEKEEAENKIEEATKDGPDFLQTVFKALKYFGIGALIVNVGGFIRTLTDLGNLMRGRRVNDFSERFLNFATAIGVIAGSMWLIGQLNAENFKRSAITLAVIVGAISSISILTSIFLKDKHFENMRKFGESIGNFGKAIWDIAKTILLLGALDMILGAGRSWLLFASGLGKMAVVLIAIAGFLALLKLFKVDKIDIQGIEGVAKAVGWLSLAMLLLGSTFKDTMGKDKNGNDIVKESWLAKFGKAFLMMVAILGSLWLFVFGLKKLAGISNFNLRGLTQLAIAVGILGIAMSAIGNMGFTQNYWAGIIFMIAALGGIAAVVWAMSKVSNVTQLGGITALVIGIVAMLVTITSNLDKIKDVDGSKLMSLAGSIAILLGSITIVIGAMALISALAGSAVLREATGWTAVVIVGIVALIWGIAEGLGALNEAGEGVQRINQGADMLNALSRAIHSFIVGFKGEGTDGGIVGGMSELESTLTKALGGALGLDPEKLTSNVEEFKTLIESISSVFDTLAGSLSLSSEENTGSRTYILRNATKLHAYNKALRAQFDNIEEFGKTMGEFEDYLGDFSDRNIVSNTNSAIDCARAVARFMTEIGSQSNLLEDTRSIWEKLIGTDNVYDKVLKFVVSFSNSIKTSATNLSGIGTEESSFTKDFEAAIGAVNSIIYTLRSLHINTPEDGNIVWNDIEGITIATTIMKDMSVAIAEFGRAVDEETGYDFTNISNFTTTLDNMRRIFSGESNEKITTENFLGNLDASQVVMRLSEFTGAVYTQMDADLKTIRESVESYKTAGIDLGAALNEGIKNSGGEVSIDVGMTILKSITDRLHGFQTAAEGACNFIVMGLTIGQSKIQEAIANLLTPNTLLSGISLDGMISAVQDKIKEFSEGIVEKGGLGGIVQSMFDNLGIDEEYLDKMLNLDALFGENGTLAKYFGKDSPVMKYLQGDTSGLLSGIDGAGFLNGESLSGIMDIFSDPQSFFEKAGLGDYVKNGQFDLGGWFLSSLDASSLSDSIIGAVNNIGFGELLKKDEKTGLINLDIQGTIASLGLDKIPVLGDMFKTDEFIETLASGEMDVAAATNIEGLKSYLGDGGLLGLLGLGEYKDFIDQFIDKESGEFTLDPITSKFSEIDTSLVGDAMNPILSVLSGYKDQFYEIGRNFTLGLANGIADSGAVGLVISNATSAVQQAIDAANQAQNSNSPSRVMEQVGRWFTEGYSGGITEGLPGVENSAKTVANAAISAMGGSVPTITPTVDLTNANDATQKLSEMFSERTLASNSENAAQLAAESTTSTILNAVEAYRNAAEAMMIIGRETMIGISEQVTEGTNAYANAETSLLTLGQSTLTSLSSMLAGGITSSPTVTPVVDLANARAASLDLSSLFGNRSFGVETTNLADRTAAAKPSRAERELVIQNGSEDVIKAVNAMGTKIDSLGERISNMQLVMDSGALVGQISGPVDKSLGRIQTRRGRI